MKYLIAGLGNIGLEYKDTRHNIGFEILEMFSEKKGWEFKKKNKLHGFLAKGKIDEDSVYLLKPTTYMNESGRAVKACRDYFKVDDILVIVDDVYIPLGEFRLKKEGSAGGHKGLLSVQEHLKGAYPRLRVGIGKNEYTKIKDYVLGKFSKEEKKMIPNILQEAIEIIQVYLKKGLDIAMNKANVRKNRRKDEKRNTTSL